MTSGNSDRELNPPGLHERALPIMLIDDEAIFRDGVAGELRRHGFAVATAANGPDASALLRGMNRPCAVILEPNLPGTSWYRLLHLAAHSAAQRRILVLTALWSRALADEAKLVGIERCLTKPISAMQIATLLEDGPPGPLSETRQDEAEPCASLASLEWEHLNHVIRRCAGNMSEAARLLGIHRPTLYKKLRKCPPRPEALPRRASGYAR